MLLNEHASYESVATELSRQTFLGGAPEHHVCLVTGTRLCRFRRPSTVRTQCEWWILFDDFVLPNRQVLYGFGRFMAGTRSRFDPMGRFLPGKGVKLGCAAPGDCFTMATLNTPVYGYLGRTVTQRPDPAEGGLALPGGELRLWIPALPEQALVRTMPPRELVNWAQPDYGRTQDAEPVRETEDPAADPAE